jgi:hypothetical protein
MDLEKEIAIAIGYHFWKCTSDHEAESCGSDAAKDVMKRIGSLPSQRESAA